VVLGDDNVMVNVVALLANNTFGVWLSTAGGEFQVAQPPPDTAAVRTSTFEENVSVCVPSVSELLTVKLGSGIAITVVLLVYPEVGVAITVN
jgi:hypothetical protein